MKTNKTKNKKKYSIIVLGICLLGLAPAKLLAWGPTGHRVIAEIAQRNLTKEAAIQVNRLLNNQPMAYWANWADFIKSDTTDTWKHTFQWHYLDAPAHLSHADFVSYISNIKEENLYSELKRITKELKDPSLPTEAKVIDLRFLIHLAGDLSQPLHTGRSEDHGGNLIDVKYFHAKTNLHSLWDTKLIDNQKYSYTEYATLLNVLPQEMKDQYEHGTLEDWLYDSHVASDRIYDITPANSSLSYDYDYKVTALLEQQLQKGGLRLSQLLNEIFK